MLFSILQHVVIINSLPVLKFIAAQDRAYAIRFNTIAISASEKRQQPYIVLGLEYFKEHEMSEIKKAYRTLARTFHPDKC